jgi:hypothetical protein
VPIRKRPDPRGYTEQAMADLAKPSRVFEWVESPARETIEIPLDEPALYLAILSYPARTDASKRKEFVEAAHAYHARIAVQYTKKHLPGRRLIVPANLRRYRKEKIDGVLNKGLRRIYQRRNGALWMAVKVWQRSVPSLRHAAGEWESFLAEHGLRTRPKNASLEEVSQNAIHRVWAESKPVLHLGFALPLEWYRRITLRLLHHLNRLPAPPDQLLGIVGSDGSFQELQLDHLLLSKAWLPEALIHAEIYRARILPALFPSIDTSETIRLIPKLSRK